MNNVDFVVILLAVCPAVMLVVSAILIGYVFGISRKIDDLRYELVATQMHILRKEGNNE